jgi:hypothetical protein
VRHVLDVRASRTALELGPRLGREEHVREQPARERRRRQVSGDGAGHEPDELRLPESRRAEKLPGQRRRYLRVEVDVVADVADRSPRGVPTERGIVRERGCQGAVPGARRSGADGAGGQVAVEVPGRLLGELERDERAHREAPQQCPLRLADQAPERRHERPGVTDALPHGPPVGRKRRSRERVALREEHRLERSVGRDGGRAVVDLSGVVGEIPVPVREDDERSVPVGRDDDPVRGAVELSGDVERCRRTRRHG